MEKTKEQKNIDKKCGCKCHTEITTTQNYYWCGVCHEKHKKDDRYTTN